MRYSWFQCLVQFSVDYPIVTHEHNLLHLKAASCRVEWCTAPSPGKKSTPNTSRVSWVQAVNAFLKEASLWCHLQSCKNREGDERVDLNDCTVFWLRCINICYFCASKKTRKTNCTWSVLLNTYSVGGAGEGDVIHLPSGLDRVDFELQEEDGSAALQFGSQVYCNV